MSSDMMNSMESKVLHNRRLHLLTYIAFLAAIVAAGLHYYRLPLHDQTESGLYRTRMVSNVPLVIHISQFVTTAERAYLLKYAQSLLGSHSPTVHRDGQVSTNSSARTSSTIFLPRDTDHMIEAIRDRASEFQGYIPTEDIDMQVTHYQEGQFFRTHRDWFGGVIDTGGWDRISTIFVTLESECEKCGTHFPLITTDWKNERWCDAIDCEEEALTTLNVPGAALYWRNLDEQGRGRMDTLHAGLTVKQGFKTGLNIWSSVRNFNSDLFDGSS